MDAVLSVAFVVALVAFLKKQFQLVGWKVLLSAFLVALVVAYVPVVEAQFPAAQVWIDPVVKVVGLFVAAAGSWDAATQLRDA